MEISDDLIVVIIANNPHDIIYKVSTEELVPITSDNTVYMCSFVNELKGDLSMTHQIDFMEAQANIVEEA